MQVLTSYESQNVRTRYRAAKSSMMDHGGSYEESKAAMDATTDIIGNDPTDMKYLCNQ